MVAEENTNDEMVNTQTAGDAPDSDLDLNDVDALRKRLQEEKERADRSYANWQRVAADMANFKRRTEQERSDASKFANAMLILNLLPIVDDLDRALQNVSAELAGLTWIDGIYLINRKLQVVLENQGLKPIEAVGQPFDPNLHEAVLHGPGEEGKVVAELQRGYVLGDRVIRPSLVKVGNGEPEEQAAPSSSMAS